MWSEHAARMPTQQAVRTFRHRKSVWFKGIYKTDGDKVRPDDLLVMQYDWDYHPGLNVRVGGFQFVNCVRGAGESDHNST
jgi:ribosomal protein L27